MRSVSLALPLVALLAAGGCVTPALTGDPAVTVTAVAETVPVGTANEDAADDPAIWRNPADPAASLVVATDKKAGLYVYALDGTTRSFLAAGLLNNVDLVTLPDGTVLVAASDRSDGAAAHIFLAALDPATGKLAPLGRIPVGSGEAYGLCLGRVTLSGEVDVFSPLKDGTVYRTTLARGASGWGGQSQIAFTLATQPEGCVVDARNGTLYVGEEMAGIWRLAPGSAQPERVAPVDNAMLVADVEGLALAPQGETGGYLVASSQGDNAYAVFRLPGMEPVGRFRIAAGAFGATEETDGIALDPAGFGTGFPGGLFIAQDGQNAPEAQNFKLVRWDDILAALGE